MAFDSSMLWIIFSKTHTDLLLFKMIQENPFLEDKILQTIRI
jgi:hypothetical protein